MTKTNKGRRLEIEAWRRRNKDVEVEKASGDTDVETEMKKLARRDRGVETDKFNKGIRGRNIENET